MAVLSFQKLAVLALVNLLIETDLEEFPNLLELQSVIN